jgi:hypothetical protein
MAYARNRQVLQWKLASESTGSFGTIRGVDACGGAADNVGERVLTTSMDFCRVAHIRAHNPRASNPLCF